MSQRWSALSPWPFDDNLFPFIPQRYQRGFMRRVLFSVTVEIHRQIGELRRQKKKPACIKLGSVCSVRFCYEQNHRNIRISDGPREYLGLPISYRHPQEGVFVESEK
jgi:hypothetical protein